MQPVLFPEAGQTWKGGKGSQGAELGLGRKEKRRKEGPGIKK